MKVNEFDLAVEIFNQSGATFNPIPAVQVLHAVDHLHFGPVNVAANDAVGLLVARHRGERAFVFGHEFHGGLRFGFQVGRQRPVAKTQRAAQAVEIQVKIQDPVVKM